MANRNKEQAAQAIAVINNLIIPGSEKLKLKTIAQKIYQSIQLTLAETSFWNSFSNSEKSYILTGNSAHTLDFTECQSTGFCGEQQPEEIPEQEENNWQEPNVFFEPSSSDSDSSEDPDYIPPSNIKRVIKTSDDSWPDSSNSALNNQPPSTSTQQPADLENQELDNNSSSESSEQDITPPSLSRNKQKPKLLVDSWKNTATTLWKPKTKVVVQPDPEAIST
jgi:hypothetical protein